MMGDEISLIISDYVCLEVILEHHIELLVKFGIICIFIVLEETL